MSKRYTDEQRQQWLASVPKKKVDVKVVLRSDKGNILLVKPDYKDTWQMPGGGVEAGEDPKPAAIREVEEETGMKIPAEDLHLKDYAFKSDDDCLFLIFEYKKMCDEAGDYAVDDPEIEEYKFVPAREVAGLLPGYYRSFWESYSA